MEESTTSSNSSEDNSMEVEDFDEIKEEASDDDFIMDEEKSDKEYANFKFNNSIIDRAIRKQFKKCISDKHNRIAPIHKDINFYYNSLNVCLGPQGCGKTTFLMKELIKLDTLPDQGHYERIVYVTNGGGRDETFNSLYPLISHLPLYCMEFNEVIPKLDAYFKKRDDSKQQHIFVILEDATFLLLKDTSTWSTWMTKLRHLRMTVWVNLHVWKSISTSIKTQITTSFIFQGYNKENLVRIFHQSSIHNVSAQTFYALYDSLGKGQCIKLDNHNGIATLITR